MDPLFRVDVLAKTPDPQQVIWRAMHQDYSENYVLDEPCPAEPDAGEAILKHLLAGERGHYGPLEHVQIAFATGYFPHSVMQQARTHRISVSFDVQSMRYTGERIIQVANALLDPEEAFYLRPPGAYTNRQGRKYTYTPEQRAEDIVACVEAAKRYALRVKLDGLSEEHARGVLPFDYRQHFVVSFTLRALLHFLDLRAKRDAQLEIQQLCQLMLPHLDAWVPQIAAWYRSSRLGKGRLAP